MNFCPFITITALLIASLITTSIATPAASDPLVDEPPVDRLVFPNKKGEVIFSHKSHLKSIKVDQCILCHRIKDPTLESIQTRFEDHRLAHSFCRGCHTKMKNGPTECHLCHNHRKTS
jgi:hypothetical protein